MSSAPRSYSVGDRVIVHPASRALNYLDGQAGEVVYVCESGILRVLLDLERVWGETLGIGPEAVEPES